MFHTHSPACLSFPMHVCMHACCRYRLMLRCWHPAAESRPLFYDVEREIRIARHSRESLSDLYNGETEPLQFQCVCALLHDLRLNSMYSPLRMRCPFDAYFCSCTLLFRCVSTLLHDAPQFNVSPRRCGIIFDARFCVSRSFMLISTHTTTIDIWELYINCETELD